MLVFSIDAINSNCSCISSDVRLVVPSVINFEVMWFNPGTVLGSLLEPPLKIIAVEVNGIPDLLRNSMSILSEMCILSGIDGVNCEKLLDLGILVRSIEISLVAKLGFGSTFITTLLFPIVDLVAF